MDYGLAGNYSKQNEQSLSMPYWAKKDDTQAVWFYKGSWRIGIKENLGTGSSTFKSFKNAFPCPESDNTKWKVRSGEDWKEADSSTKVLINPGKTINKQPGCFIPHNIELYDQI